MWTKALVTATAALLTSAIGGLAWANMLLGAEPFAGMFVTGLSLAYAFAGMVLWYGLLLPKLANEM